MYVNVSPTCPRALRWWAGMLFAVPIALSGCLTAAAMRSADLGVPIQENATVFVHFTRDDPPIVRYRSPEPYQAGGDMVSFKTLSSLNGDIVLPALACARWRFGTCSSGGYSELVDDGNPAWLGTESPDLHPGCTARREDARDCPVTVLRSASPGARIVAYAPDGTRCVDHARTSDKLKAAETLPLEMFLWPTATVLMLRALIPAGPSGPR